TSPAIRTAPAARGSARGAAEFPHRAGEANRSARWQRQRVRAWWSLGAHAPAGGGPLAGRGWRRAPPRYAATARVIGDFAALPLCGPGSGTRLERHRRHRAFRPALGGKWLAPPARDGASILRMPTRRAAERNERAVPRRAILRAAGF